MNPEKNNLNLELTGLVDATAAAANKNRLTTTSTEDPVVADLVDKILDAVGGKPGTMEHRLVRDLLMTSSKLIPDGRHTGELKLITTAVKEMRYAYRVFARYEKPHKVTIFGSARTPETHPDYKAAVEFGRLMSEAGWMAITGAGDGIMKAGHEGPGRAQSFGVAIRLPFEQATNTVIAGDEKLIHFRYFFTRKLMFISQAEAVALFPGGFGTMDEAYETLTLVQTGKASMVPIVCVEGEEGSPNHGYWNEFDHWVREGMIKRGWVSPEDTNLYYIAKTPKDAVDHIVRFYSNYHSSRYVKDDFVIRLKKPLLPMHVEQLNDEFKVLVKEGEIVQRGPFEAETDALDLPRLVFHHTRYKWGMVRKLIDRINELSA